MDDWYSHFDFKWYKNAKDFSINIRGGSFEPMFRWNIYLHISQNLSPLFYTDVDKLEIIDPFFADVTYDKFEFDERVFGNDYMHCDNDIEMATDPREGLIPKKVLAGATLLFSNINAVMESRSYLNHYIEKLKKN